MYRLFFPSGNHGYSPPSIKPLLSQGLKIVAYLNLRKVGIGRISTSSRVEDIHTMLPEKHHISDTGYKIVTAFKYGHLIYVCFGAIIILFLKLPRAFLKWYYFDF
jgi:hypothetical protein